MVELFQLAIVFFDMFGGLILGNMLLTRGAGEKNKHLETKLST